MNVKLQDHRWMHMVIIELLARVAPKPSKLAKLCP
jgi:hypothetical protein